jgi:phenylalanyl-tRNA synthetase beta chain
LALFITGNKNEESWISKSSASDFNFIKGFVHLILRRIGLRETLLSPSDEVGTLFEIGLKYSVDDLELVRFGAISKNSLKKFDIDQEVYYADFNYETLLKLVQKNNIQFKPVPKYPEVKRDLALLVDKSIQFSQIRDLALKTEKKLLKNVKIFDVYIDPKIGKDKKSYAVNFVLQDVNKTLNDKQIEKVMKNLMSVFKDKLGAEIR